jgi:hypothetical protein
VATRLTYTEKWEDDWFFNLKPLDKLLWLYVLDKCSHSGIWKPNLSTASVFLGYKITEENINKLDSKIKKIDQETYFIPSFFMKQFGKAKDSWQAKINALKELSQYGIILDGDKVLISDPKEDVSTTHPPTHPPQVVDQSIELNCIELNCISINSSLKKNPNTTSQKKEKSSVVLNLESMANQIAELWNEEARKHSFRRVTLPLAKDRVELLREPIRQYPDLNDWKKIVSQVSMNPFNLGHGTDGWKADFDWLLRKTKNNYRKLLEDYNSSLELDIYPEEPEEEFSNVLQGLGE